MISGMMNGTSSPRKSLESRPLQNAIAKFRNENGTGGYARGMVTPVQNYNKGGYPTISSTSGRMSNVRTATSSMATSIRPGDVTPQVSRSYVPPQHQQSNYVTSSAQSRSYVPAPSSISSTNTSTPQVRSYVPPATQSSTSYVSSYGGSSQSTTYVSGVSQSPSWVPSVSQSPSYVPPVSQSPSYAGSQSPSYVPPVSQSPSYVPPVSQSPSYVPPSQVSTTYDVPAAFPSSPQRKAVPKSPNSYAASGSPLSQGSPMRNSTGGKGPEPERERRPSKTFASSSPLDSSIRSLPGHSSNGDNAHNRLLATTGQMADNAHRAARPKERSPPTQSAPRTRDRSLENSLHNPGSFSYFTHSREKSLEQHCEYSIGDVTSVQNRNYIVVRQLGQGSFSKVWLVQDYDESCQDEFALKVSICTPADRREKAAVFEVKVLQHLEANLPTDIKQATRVPFYISHCIDRQPGGGTRVSIAMTRLFGTAFDQWLYGVDEEVQKTMNPMVFLKGPLPKGEMATMHLTNACAVSCHLLLTMCPVFSVLSTFAFHRDVSAHNFLVSDQYDASRDPKEGPSLQFALLDFGLAAAVQGWSKECLTTSICGDPRYWPPGAWMLLAFGAKYIWSHPNQGFLKQYQDRLDHFAMGILCLEVFFTLWDGLWNCVGEQLGQVHTAWCCYWKQAFEVFQAFHREEIESFRKQIAQKQTITKLDKGLQALRQSLRHFARSVPNHAAASLFSVCANLIDESATLSWTAAMNALKTKQVSIQFSPSQTTRTASSVNSMQVGSENVVGSSAWAAAQPSLRRNRTLSPMKSDPASPDQTSSPSLVHYVTNVTNGGVASPVPSFGAKSAQDIGQQARYRSDRSPLRQRTLGVTTPGVGGSPPVIKYNSSQRTRLTPR